MTWSRNFSPGGTLKPKYRNKKCEADGYEFDSLLERAVYWILKQMQTAKLIEKLQVKPPTVFLSDARIQYRPDFKFFDCKMRRVTYCEAKGRVDQKWPLKRKLWKAYGPNVLWIYSGVHTDPFLKETIIPVNQKLTEGTEK